MTKGAPLLRRTSHRLQLPKVGQTTRSLSIATLKAMAITTRVITTVITKVILETSPTTSSMDRTTRTIFVMTSPMETSDITTGNTDYPMVGARLQDFTQMWTQITSDRWILEIIQRGYSLEFTSKPPPFKTMKITPIPRNPEARSCLEQEIVALLGKGATETVPQREINGGFYSTFFLTPKKSGGLRPILNVRPLNQFLLKKHFRMETLNTVLKAIQPGDWGVVLDLKDAYHHIGIALEHRKFLRFHFLGKSFQFRALPFGPRTAPRVFTKVTSVLGEFLHKRGIRIHMYLDDWILLHQSRGQLLHHLHETLQLTESLGFLVNWEKSQLEPSQTLSYLGARLFLGKGLVTPTEERFQKLCTLCLQTVAQTRVPASQFLQVLGLMVSMIDLVPHARLFLRPIKLYLLSQWKPSSQDLDQAILVRDSLRPHLKW